MHGQDTLEIALVFLLAAVVSVPLFRRLGLGAVLGYLVAGYLWRSPGLGVTLPLLVLIVLLAPEVVSGASGTRGLAIAYAADTHLHADL